MRAKSHSRAAASAATEAAGSPQPAAPGGAAGSRPAGAEASVPHRPAGAGDAEGFRPIGAGSFAEVRELLRESGFSHYAGALEDVGLDTVRLLATATDDELQGCGVKRVHGSRIREEAKARSGAAVPRTPAREPAPVAAALPGATSSQRLCGAFASTCI